MGDEQRVRVQRGLGPGFQAQPLQSPWGRRASPSKARATSPQPLGSSVRQETDPRGGRSFPGWSEVKRWEGLLVEEIWFPALSLSLRRQNKGLLAGQRGSPGRRQVPTAQVMREK